MRRWNLQSFDSPAETPEPVAASAASPRVVSGGGLPSVDNLEQLHHKIHEEAFLKGLREGVEEGRIQGQQLGHAEGVEAGKTEGYRDGYQKGYDDGLARLSPVEQEFRAIVGVLTDIPRLLSEDIAELAYQTALRIAGREELDRHAFVRAVQEALAGLPQAGESLTIRVPEADVETWRSLVQHPDLPFLCTISVDRDLSPGHAYVESRGVRLDIGSEARRAIVRSALGLLTSDSRRA